MTRGRDPAPAAGGPRPEEGRSDLAFWTRVGASFPSLKGAASTAYYAECEQILLAGAFRPLRGARLFKTDLWDEAKNTEILRWAAEEGARPFGVDISLPIVLQAREVLRGHRPGLAVADVRALPFRDRAFDLVYSMGTIEHFPEYAAALGELRRVLRPGGRAAVGVPNKLDPFLRPLLVAVLQRAGLYAYGEERSFTPRALRRLLEEAGFRVGERTGILFLPGWLRMADLLLYTRWPALARATGWLVRPFAGLYRRLPRVRRHGYLLAMIAERPAGPAARPAHEPPR